MRCVIKRIMPQYRKHRTLVIGTWVPNILESLFLKPRAFAYIGAGKEWFVHPKLTPLKLRKRRLRKFLKAYDYYSTFANIYL